MPTVHVFVPCYKRPEYTVMCLAALSRNTFHRDTEFTLVDDGSKDDTERILREYAFYSDADLVISPENKGLRYRILQFWLKALKSGADFVTMVDNDQLVPAGWITNLLDIFDAHPELDILSPDNHPSHATLAMCEGKKFDKRYRLTFPHTVGIWFMRRRVLEGLPIQKWTEAPEWQGIKGAWELLLAARQKGFVMGATTEVCFQDVGYHHGTHPLHIKSAEHRDYSLQVGRPVKWPVTGVQG